MPVDVELDPLVVIEGDGEIVLLKFFFLRSQGLTAGACAMDFEGTDKGSLAFSSFFCSALSIEPRLHSSSSTLVVALVTAVVFEAESEATFGETVEAGCGAVPLLADALGAGLLCRASVDLGVCIAVEVAEVEAEDWVLRG